MDIPGLIKKYGILSAMQTDQQLIVILSSLFQTIEREIPGDVVELGCLGGTASVFLGRVLLESGSPKELHLYDSFEGLPTKGDQDGNDDGYLAGGLVISQTAVEYNVKAVGYNLAKVHKGWFNKIPDRYYPTPISFALFDGDFYQSILDSFAKVYHKVSPGGVICVHDYEFPRLPGVKIACDEFLEGKSDTVEVRESVLVITKV